MNTNLDLCRLCGKRFKRRKNIKGTDRKSLGCKLKFSNDTTIAEGLQQLNAYSGPKDGYVCGPCFTKLSHDHRQWTSIDHPIPTSTPNKLEPISSTPSTLPGCSRSTPKSPTTTLSSSTPSTLPGCSRSTPKPPTTTLSSSTQSTLPGCSRSTPKPPTSTLSSSTQSTLPGCSRSTPKPPTNTLSSSTQSTLPGCSRSTPKPPTNTLSSSTQSTLPGCSRSTPKPPTNTLLSTTEPCLSPIALATPARKNLFHSPRSLKKTPSATKVISTKKSKREHNLSRITSFLRSSKYKRAFQEIVSQGRSASTALGDHINQQIKREMQALATNARYPILDGLTSLERFSWADLITELKRKAPTIITHLFSAMLCRQPSKKKMLKWEQAKQEEHYRSIIVPRIGLMMSIIMYTLNPTRFQFIQSIVGIQLWRCGGSEKLVKALNRLGICQSATVNRKNIDKICAESDRDLQRWKEALDSPEAKSPEGVPSAQSWSHFEQDEPISHCDASSSAATDWQSSGLPTDNVQQPSVLPSLHGSSSRTDQTIKSFEFPSETESDDTFLRESMLSTCSVGDSTVVTEASCLIDPETSTKGRGFAFVWDNTQKLSHARDQGRDHKNKMLLWANAYAAQNRVEPDPCLEQNTNRLWAKDISLSTYFQSNDDEEMLHSRMDAIVGRILVKHIPHFKDNYQDVVVWHIPHQYAEESSIKSNLVNIGIIDENPSTTEGTAAIMRALQVHVPRLSDGTFRVVPTHGDGLSVERMTDAKRGHTIEPTDIERLDGLEQTPQEFHHRGLMLQDMINLLFSGRSIAERGTLSQLKNDFQHNNVTTDVMNSFNHVDDFIRFVTKAHVTYLAMVLLKMNHLTDFPDGSGPNADKNSRLQYFSTICSQVVATIWQGTTKEEVTSVVEAECAGVSDHGWCVCGEDDHDEDDRLIKCSNYECPFGIWYHMKCMGIDQCPLPTADWWCSDHCRDSQSSILCHCKTIKDGAMATCALKNECQQGICFHLQCVHLEHLPDETWYCSTACAAIGGLPSDHVQSYALSVTWHGLLDLCHRDTIREADGLAMMAYWRLNFPRFWRGNHYKYMIIAHRLQAGIAGWLPPRLIEEIIHNRTVNLRGGKGNNIAMDRVCEFLNAEFKGAFTEFDFLKIWKGLHYCMWMSDKSLVQEELATSLSELVHCFTDPKYSVLFLSAFFTTESREWFNIDRLRLDKFMMLIRKVLHQTFLFLKKNEWEEKVVEEVLTKLATSVLSPDPFSAPEGLKLHVADIFLDELLHAGAQEVEKKVVSQLLDPYCIFICRTKSQPAVKRVIKDVFFPLMEMEMERLEEEKEKAEEDEDEDENKEKEENSDEEEDSDEEESPRFNVDYKHFADRLFHLASGKGCPSKSRRGIYSLVKTYKNLAEGILPEVKELEDEPEGERMNFDKAIQRLNNFEDLLMKRTGKVPREKRKHKAADKDKANEEPPNKKKKQEAEENGVSDSADETEGKAGKKEKKKKKKVHEINPAKKAKIEKEKKKKKNSPVAASDEGDTETVVVIAAGDGSVQTVQKDKEEINKALAKQKLPAKPKQPEVEVNLFEGGFFDSDEEEEVPTLVKKKKKKKKANTEVETEAEVQDTDEQPAPSPTTSAKKKKKKVQQNGADVSETTPEKSDTDVANTSVSKKKKKKRQSVGATETEETLVSKTTDSPNKNDRLSEESPKNAADVNSTKKKKKRKSLGGGETQTEVVNGDAEVSTDTPKKKLKKSKQKSPTNNSSEDIQEGEVEIMVPNKKYKGQFKEAFEKEMKKNLTKGNSPKNAFMSFESAGKTPPAFVRRVMSKLNTPKTEPRKKLREELLKAQSESVPDKKRRVSFVLERNMAQDFEDSLTLSPVVPFDPQNQPDRAILKSGGKKKKSPRSKASDFF